MAIMEVEWKRSPEVVILRPGVNHQCPLRLIREAKNDLCWRLDMLSGNVQRAREIFNDVDQYFYVRGRRWALNALIDAYATEISSHERWKYLHTIYIVPDDFADVLGRVMLRYDRARDIVDMRRKLREVMKLPWEELKDRLLAMEAAEAL